MDKSLGPIGALILGGVLLIGAGQLPKAPLKNSTLSGCQLFCITEKLTPSIQETLAIREARAFCEANGFVGYFYLDDDDAMIQPIITAASTKNIQSPMLVAAKIEAGKITKLDRVRKWETGLQDILK